MGWSTGTFHWNVQCRHTPQDWEEEVFDRFMGLVYFWTVRGFGPDKICWKPTRNRGFEVKGYYSSFYPPTLVSFPRRMIWQSKVPSRVAFFSWSASLGKILTTDNLRKRCVLVLDWCYMCKRCEESVDHLLLHCPIVWELWSLVFYLFGIQWVMPHTVLELFEAWQGKFAWHRHIDVWRLVPHCLIWCIWRERNARSFEGCEHSLLEIKSFLLLTLFEWSVVFSHFSCSSFPIFLDRCTFVSWFVPP